MSNASTASPVQQGVTLPKFIPRMYMAYNFMSAFGTTLPLTYLVFFITEFTGVSPGLMATVYTVARFADLGVSLFSGPIIQRQKRVRPWLLIVPLVSGTGGIISFLNPNIPLNAKLVVLIIGYCMIHFVMNFSTVVGNTVMMKIAGGNPENRVAITQNQMRGSSASGIVISAISMPLILYFQNTLGLGGRGYLIIAIAYFIIWMVANTMLFIVSAPYEPKDIVATSPTSNVQRVTIAQMYRAAGSNSAILVLLTCAVLTGIAGQCFSSGALYYFKYVVMDLSKQPLVGTVGGFVGLGAAILMPPIARKLGKKKSVSINYFFTIATYIVIFLFAAKSVWIYLFIIWIGRLSTPLSTTWGINLWLDAAEVQLYETGVDNRPFLMSLNNIPIKVGFIASGPFVAFLLNNSGYQVIDGVGSLANTTSFMFVWLGLVAVLWLAAGFLFLIGYKVSPDYAAECIAANAEKAKTAAAEAAKAAETKEVKVA
ncbi:MAG: MFS transporter [Coriobacteriia bacterium]|nr:MFS transporter [Coriobacteriia bacterium]